MFRWPSGIRVRPGVFVAVLLALAACKGSSPPAERILPAPEPSAVVSAAARPREVPSEVPSRCRALVNVSFLPKNKDPGSYYPEYRVVEVRFDEQIGVTSGPGLVLQEDGGLVGLQLVRYETSTRAKRGSLARQWSTLLARRLPGGSPAVWFNGEPEPPGPDDLEGSWGLLNTREVGAVIGPHVSLHGHHVLHSGAIYGVDEWPVHTMSAPDGKRVRLSSLASEPEIASIKNGLRSPTGTPDDGLGSVLDGFGFVFGGFEPKTSGGLGLLASSETPSPGGRVALGAIPAGLSPHLSVSFSEPALLGHPRGCASVGVIDGELQARRRGETRSVPLSVPGIKAPLSMIGVAWISMEDPFSLGQLSPSGLATSKEIAPVAPPIQHR